MRKPQAIYPYPGPLPRATAPCMGCGCTYYRTCPDGCSWLKLGGRGIGVCSNCEEHLKRWPAPGTMAAMKTKNQKPAVNRETLVVLDRKLIALTASNLRLLTEIVKVQAKLIEDLAGDVDQFLVP